MVVSEMIGQITARQVSHLAREQAGQDHGHRHRLGPHAQHRAFADRVEQVFGRGLAGGNALVPGLAQVQQHDDAELGGHAGQRDEAHRPGDRQVVAQQLEQPDAADQREGQGGHDQQGLVEAAEGQVQQHEDDQQRERHDHLQLGGGALQELELARPRDRVARRQRRPCPATTRCMSCTADFRSRPRMST